MRSAVLVAAVASAVVGGGEGSAQAARALTLSQAVDLALRADPVVAEARIATDRSQLAVLRAQLDRITLSIDGTLREGWTKANLGGATIYSCTILGVTYQTDPGTCMSMNGTSSVAPPGIQSPEGWQGNSNLAAQVNVPLFAGFRISSNVALRKRQHDAALVSIRQSSKDIALSVARAYWAVRRLELTRDAALAALRRLRDSEAVATARVSAGLVPPIDENRARSRRLKQESAVNDLAGQAREQGAQLATLLGIAEDIALVDPPEVPQAGPPPLADLVETALGSRPEVARAKIQYAAQEQVVRIARADYFPQLSLYGLFQYGNNQFNPSSGASSFSTAANPFANLSGNIQMGAVLKINFFNMLNTWTSTGDARYELARLGQEIRLARRNVESEVRVAHERLDHLYHQREPLLAAVEVARDNVAILEARYRNGESPVLDVFDAQIELGDVERQLADLSGLIRLAWLELDAALGTVVGVGP